MYQRDYLLRMIEQLGTFLIALRNRILGRKADSAAVDQELADVAGRAGMNLELLRRFSEETLVMFASPTGEIEPARCWLMAEILYLDGLQANLEGRTEDARSALSKARLLYTLVEPAGGMLVGLPEAAQRIDEIDSLLADAG